jgi:hypothetical protein
MDNIRENIEYLGDNVQIGGVSPKDFGGAISATRTAIGTYTGNGSAAQAITGIGFQPDFVYVYNQSSSLNPFIKSDQDGTKAKHRANIHWEDDHLISLDSDGFTVGDGTGGLGNNMNVNSTIYTYLALEA